MKGQWCARAVATLHSSRGSKPHADRPLTVALRDARAPAFTMLELLVVVAIMCILMAILLPSMTRARQQAKSAVCLSNMRQLGVLLHAYSNEDRSAQIIPIHYMMIRPTGNPWITGIGHSFMWGGRDGQRPLPGDCGDVWLSGDERGYVPPGMPGPAYGATARPLNRYYLGTDIAARERVDMPVFRCPEDRGLPEATLALPSAVAGVPCFDLFGNSYEAQTLTAFVDEFGEQSGAFSWGTWGHRLNTIPSPDRLVLAAEPTFFLSGLPGVGDWHGRQNRMNVMFVDGSARATSTQKYPLSDDATLLAMGLPLPQPICPSNAGLITQGLGWRLDVWPTPGARIWGLSPLWTDDECRPFSTRAISDCYDRKHWPFPGYEQNLE
jgi:prepilin-type N-terminal cleavage/methylation domain-containing protein/prepilin-type processing-associated H-X9-DG protein